MKSKKGNLLPEEVLKIVIAVISIGFLIFLLVSLYFSLTGKEKQKQAEASMNGENALLAEVNRINNGGTPKPDGHFVQNPSGWYVLGFVGGDLKPNSCTGSNCVCICESVVLNVFNWEKRQLKKCDEKGSCSVFPNLMDFEKIKIENNGVYLSIRKINSGIEITRK